MTSRLESRLKMLAALVVCSGFVGCSMFQEQLQPTLDSKVVPSDGLTATPSEEKYAIELHPSEGKPTVIEKTLTGGEAMHVQDALEATGAHKKYKRFFLELMRPMPSGGWHEMTLAYDRPSKRVAPEFDYAVLPGDRIVITQDPSTLFDDIVEPVLKPLGFAKREDRRSRVTDKYRVHD